jgi:hypothetical protein
MNAQKALTAAQDNYNRRLEIWHHATGPAAIAAARQLETAVTALQKAHNRLASVQVSATTIQQGLNKAIGGQAAAAAQTNAGKLLALEKQVHNLAEQLGNFLLPKILAVTSWLGRHKKIVEALAAVIATALVVAMAAYITKLIIASAQTLLLVARTLALNTQVAIAIVRHRANAGAMDVEAASALRLTAASKALLAVDALLVATAAKGLSNLPHDFHSLKNAQDEMKRLRGLLQTGTAQQKAIISAHWAEISAGFAATQKQSTWDKITGNVHTGALEKALLAVEAALRDPTTQLNTRLHNPGFIGPTVAESHPNMAGPIPDWEKGVIAKAKAAVAAAAKTGAILDIHALDAWIAAAVKAAQSKKKKLVDHTKERLAALRELLERQKAAAVAAVERREMIARLAYEKTLAALREQLRRKEVELKLARRGEGDLSIVNGAALNRGSSFAQLSAVRQSGQTNVTIQAGGVFMDATQLARLLADVLRGDGRRNVSVGLA